MFLECLMFLACWECQMLRHANSKLLWRRRWYPPATEINFWFRFAKSSNFLLSRISSQEKLNARYNRCPTYLRLWSLSTLLADSWRSPSIRESTMQRADVLSKRAGFSTVSARLQRRGESYFSTYCSNFPLDCLWTLSVPGGHRMVWAGCDIFWDRSFSEPYPRRNMLMRCFGFFFYFPAGVRVWNTTTRYIALWFRHTDRHLYVIFHCKTATWTSRQACE